MGDFGIGRLAALRGVKVPTIRYYEQIGLLLAPSRTSGGQRRYDGRTVARLTFILNARNLGFEVDEVRELLTLADRPNDPCRKVVAIAQLQIKRIDARMKLLRAMRRELMQVITACPATRIKDCPIIEALSKPSGNRASTTESRAAPKSRCKL